MQIARAQKSLTAASLPVLILFIALVTALSPLEKTLGEDSRAASASNLVFGAALWWFLGNIQNVLHPDSPILQSDAGRIQAFFGILVVLSIIFGALLGRLLYKRVPEHWK